MPSFLALATLAPAQATDQAPQPGPPPPSAAQPKAALDWFRRADALTNIRLPGSAPFHLKVAFHAYPASELASPDTSVMITGDGTCEETWVSPEQWRREIKFGAYHAIEVRANGVRKFQSTADYEPLRVMLLLRAILEPIPRYTLEPALFPHPPKWTIEQRTAGAIAYTHITHQQSVAAAEVATALDAFDFLPGGIPVRSEQETVINTWQDDTVFAGKIVPGRVTVAAMTRPLVEATIAIEPLAHADPAAFDLPGGPASPAVTLRPLIGYTRRSGEALNASSVPAASLLDGPVGTGFWIELSIDRQGIPREWEVIDTQPVFPDISKAPLAYRKYVSIFQSAVQHLRYSPALMDNDPCQDIGIWIVVKTSNSGSFFAH